MNTRLQSNDQAKALAGRSITEIDLGMIEDDSGSPSIKLDDGSVLTFDVDDYGSGTYGVNVEIDRPKTGKAKAKGKALHLPEATLLRLAACAARENTNVETLAERWLAERENDEMRRRLLKAAGANEPDPLIVCEKTCAVTMFDLRVQLSSDGRERGLWVFLRDHSPERERQHAGMTDHERDNPRFNGGRLDEGGLLEWPAARAFHAAMGKALRKRPR